MYAVIDISAGYGDSTGLYHNVVAIQETADGWTEQFYSYKDLSQYTNGSEVQAGWRYYLDTDTFAPEPVKYYYAQLDENGVVTGVIESTDDGLASSTMIMVPEGYRYTLTNNVYRDGKFIKIDVYTMLVAEQILTKLQSNTETPA